jgi:uncharacterized protein YbjQ (UPF0145 family)
LPSWRNLGKIFKELPEARRGRVVNTYFRASVAKTHVLLGEIALRQSAQARSTDQRIACAREAAACADRSAAVDKLHDEAPLLKGRALIRLAYLYEERGAKEEARKAYDEGKAVLTGLLTASPQSAAAQRVLENVPPPDEKEGRKQ